jgi:hypothetical protein
MVSNEAVIAFRPQDTEMGFEEIISHASKPTSG